MESLTIRCCLWADTTRYAIRVPFTYHDLSVYVLKINYIAMHVIHSLLHSHKVWYECLEALFKFANLLVNNTNARFDVSLQCTCLHKFVQNINFTIFSKLYYFVVHLLNSLLHLFLNWASFFPYKLLNFYLSNNHAF